MISDSTRTVAAIIVVAIVLAATTPFFVGGRVDGLSLRARDIGPGWQENSRHYLNYTGFGVFSENIAFSEIVIMSNGTSIIVSRLIVFESSDVIDKLFLFQDLLLIFHTAEEVDIGDLGYLYRCSPNTFYGVGIGDQTFLANPSNIASLVFVQDDTLSAITVSVKGVDTLTQPWIWDFILDVGVKQLQKIDRYSS
jgi:hypothetical protein